MDSEKKSLGYNGDEEDKKEGTSSEEGAHFNEDDANTATFNYGEEDEYDEKEDEEIKEGKTPIGVHKEKE